MRQTIRSIAREEHALLGTVLKNLRLRAGITQRELGPFIGKTHSYIGKVERGTQHIDVATLFDYINAVGADPTQVVAEVYAQVPKGRLFKKAKGL